MTCFSIINQGVEEKIFNKYQNLIANILSNLLTQFDFDYDIDVYLIRDKDLYISDKAIAGQIKYIDDKYVILLTLTGIFYAKRYGSTEILEATIYHELCHLDDALKCIKSCKDFKPSLKNYYNLNDCLADIGFAFFSEYLAYYATYQFDNNNDELFTFTDLLITYESIKGKCDLIVLPPVTKENYEVLDAIFNQSHYFVYQLSVFLSHYICIDKDILEHKKHKHFSDIIKILNELTSILIKTSKEKYSDNHYKNLIQIGYVILKTIYNQFKMNLSMDEENGIMYSFTM